VTGPHHHPPELLALLIDTIPRLCKSKRDVLIFFQGAGVPASMLRDVAVRVQGNREAISKFEIARVVLARLNDAGDAGLAPRREVLRRVVEYEDFSSCWPNDRLEAEGLVARVRAVVNVKDSFTKLRQEHDRERRAHQEQRAAAAEEAARVRTERVAVREAFYGVFGETNPQRRGTRLEQALNDAFRVYGIHVQDAFVRRAPEGVALEQIDGVIVLDGHVTLVEMKWYADPLGPGEVSQHLVRLYGRADVHGLIISYSGYTPAAVDVCRTALVQRVVTLCTLQEMVGVLARDGDRPGMLRQKVLAALLQKEPWSPAS
jgi:restriction system protein